MKRRYVVPGRVEIVGKHVDYGGGRSLTCAVEFAMHATARPLPSPILRVLQGGSRQIVEMKLSPEARPTRSPWSNYVAAVARRVTRDFPFGEGGVEMRLDSGLPTASGLSSSTALTIALVRAVVDATGVAQHADYQALINSQLAFAEYVAAVETGAPFANFPGDAGVGVRGGAQDHIAIVCARDGMLGQFSYMPAREERRVSWPSEYAIAIGISGVRASKAGNVQRAYNRTSDAVRWLVQEWNGLASRNDPTLAAALASSRDAPDRLMSIARKADGAPVSAAYLAGRLDQFREECGVIVPAVADALHRRDLSTFGTLVDRSQYLAESVLENQVPQTVELARSARELGAAAASAFGAGFGGAVWAMVRTDDITEFLERWKLSFERAFPVHGLRARFLVTRPGPGASMTIPSTGISSPL